MSKVLRWKTQLRGCQPPKFPFILQTLLVLMSSMIVGGALAQDMITGTVTYRERVLLQPGAVLELTLEDVSLADAKAEILTSTRTPDPGAPPYSFSLPYNAEKIIPNHSYNVRARITENGKLRFHTDVANPVLTRGAPDTVDIVLRMTGSAALQTPQEPTRTGAHGLALPGTFRGELPCADCEGIFYQLTLWPDQSYFLRQIWRGPEHVVDTLGRWHVEPETNTLVLTDGAEDATRFRIGTNNDLRLLDREGNEIESDLNYSLVAGDLADFNASLNLRGMYSVVDERLAFVECLTQRMFPIAEDGAFKDLPEANSNSPVMISFDGHFEYRQTSDSNTETTVIVDRFVNAWPGETCERNLVDANLTNTYWKIMRLGDTDVESIPNHREPHLVLTNGEPRYSATVGCNKLAGGYELDGNSLKFLMGMTTLMACQPPLDELERLLAQTLSKSADWKIDGQVLELFDSSGGSLALFKAVYLP